MPLVVRFYWGVVEKHKYPCNRLTSLNIMGMILISKVSNHKNINLWICRFRWHTLHSIKVCLQPTELYTNLSLTLKKASITYFQLFHVMIEVTKYSYHSTNMYLPWCIIITPHVKNKIFNIKPPKGDCQIGTDKNRPVT